MDVIGIVTNIAAALVDVEFGQVSFLFQPDDLPGPCIVIGPPERIDYFTSDQEHSLRLDTMHLPITLYASRADAKDAHIRLYEAMSTGTDSSIIDAITAYPGAWKAIFVRSAQRIRPVTIGSTTWAAVDFTVVVVAARQAPLS